MRIRLRQRPVLLTAVAAGLAAGLLAGLRLPASMAVLTGWCVAAVLYAAASSYSLAGATPEGMRRRAAALEDDKWTVLGASLATAIASLVAVVADLAGSGGSAALAAVTVLVSWVFIHVVFAGHYAHDHWLSGGLDFPGNDSPDYAEFLYFSFTVGMTCQVSDVTTKTASMRRLVLLHGLVAFVFNAVILAATVNVAAGLAR